MQLKLCSILGWRTSTGKGFYQRRWKLRTCLTPWPTTLMSSMQTTNVVWIQPNKKRSRARSCCYEGTAYSTCSMGTTSTAGRKWRARTKSVTRQTLLRWAQLLSQQRPREVPSYPWWPILYIKGQLNRSLPLYSLKSNRSTRRGKSGILESSRSRLLKNLRWWTRKHRHHGFKPLTSTGSKRKNSTT